MVKFAFFGTDEFSVNVLEVLKKEGLEPQLIITPLDKPKGRKLILTPPLVKLWAEKNNIPFSQPEKLDSHFIKTLELNNFALFLVASYGQILPKEIIYLPKFKTLNIHPSLLPRLRGPSPIQEIILRGEKPGVTLMRVDQKMDHGPIVAKKELESDTSNFKFQELRDALAKLGVELFVEVLPKWVSGEIKEVPQNDSFATYTKLIKKEDGLIDFSGNPELNYRKFLAYNHWPGTYFFKHGKRVKVTDAEFARGKFIIKKVVPESGKEIDYEAFLKKSVTSSFSN